MEWLREHCSPPLEDEEIAELLTMTGTKVEAIHTLGVREPDRFRVGLVRSVERHPDADRLSVCRVDLGGAEQGEEGLAQIVCGAPNVAAGQLVAVALPGAVLPDGTRLRSARLRGVQSAGMILSAAELGLAAESEGILVLDRSLLAGSLRNGASPDPGTPLGTVFAIAGRVLELEITPNRPDCMAIYGVARELHAASGAALAQAPWSEDPGAAGPIEGVQISVECPQLCPRFTARLFEQVAIGPSPLWLQARLLAAGQRPINNVVDITNYVMLLSGQPSHAFDLDRLAGRRLTVRLACAGESLRTLDGEERTVDEQTVLIADEQGPTSIAGLMGGERSEVSAETKRVLIEVATWDGPNIHRSAHALGLRSEASARFERGLHPASCMWAQALITQMMAAVCQARPVGGTIDISAPDALAGGPEVALRAARVAALLGREVSAARQREILQALGFGVSEAHPGSFAVTVPPWRAADVSREADLIEEIARIDGLERLPATMPAARGLRGGLSAPQRLRRRLADLLVDRGLFEIAGWSFCSAEDIAELRFGDTTDPRGHPVALINPLSDEQALLRTTLLTSLRRVAAYNAARDRFDLALFEIGRVFARAPQARGSHPGAAAGIAEATMLGVLASGRIAPAGWRRTGAARWDAFAVKALLEAIAQTLGVELRCDPAPEDRHPFLHPGRAAEIVLAGARAAGGARGRKGAGVEDASAGDEVIGWLGELHPLLLAGSLSGAVALELDLGRLLGAAAAVRRRFRPISPYPALYRDLSFELPDSVPVERLRVAISIAQGEESLIERIEVGNVYVDKQMVAAGTRSVTVSLTFRRPDRTLSEAEVEELVDRVVRHVEAPEIGARLRGAEGAP